MRAFGCRWPLMGAAAQRRPPRGFPSCDVGGRNDAPVSVSGVPGGGSSTHRPSYHHLAIIGSGSKRGARGGGGRGNGRGGGGVTKKTSSPQSFKNSASAHTRDNINRSRSDALHDGDHFIGSPSHPAAPSPFPHYSNSTSEREHRKKELVSSNREEITSTRRHPTHSGGVGGSNGSNSSGTNSGLVQSSITAFKRSPIPMRTFQAAMQVLNAIGQRLMQCEAEFTKVLHRNNLSNDEIMRITTEEKLTTKTGATAIAKGLASLEEEGDDWFSKLGQDAHITEEGTLDQFGAGFTPRSTAQQSLNHIQVFLATFSDFRMFVLSESALTLAERSNFYATCIGMLTEAVDVNRAKYLSRGGSANMHTPSQSTSSSFHDESGVRQKFSPPNVHSRRSTDPPSPFVASALGCIAEAKAFRVPLTVYHYLPLLRSQLLVRSDPDLPLRLLNDAVKTVKETIYLFGRGDVRFKRATLRHATTTRRNEDELNQLRRLAESPLSLVEGAGTLRGVREHDISGNDEEDSSPSESPPPRLSSSESSLHALLQSISVSGDGEFEGSSVAASPLTHDGADDDMSSVLSSMQQQSSMGEIESRVQASTQSWSPLLQEGDQPQRRPDAATTTTSPFAHLEISSISLAAAQAEAELVVGGAQVAVATGYALSGKWEHALLCTPSPKAFKRVAFSLVDSGRWEAAARLVAHMIPHAAAEGSGTGLPGHPVLHSAIILDSIAMVGRQAIEAYLHSTSEDRGFLAPPASGDDIGGSSGHSSGGNRPSRTVTAQRIDRLENPCAMTKVHTLEVAHIYDVLFGVVQRFGFAQWVQWKRWREAHPEAVGLNGGGGGGGSTIPGDMLMAIGSEHYASLGFEDAGNSPSPPAVTVEPTFLSKTLVELLILAAPAAKWSLGISLLTTHTLHQQAKYQFLDASIVLKARQLAKLRSEQQRAASVPNAASIAKPPPAITAMKIIEDIKYLNQTKERVGSEDKVALGVVLRALHRAHRWEAVLRLYNNQLPESEITDNSQSSALLRHACSVTPNVFTQPPTPWGIVDKGHVLLSLGQAMLYHGDAFSPEGRSTRTMPQFDDEEVPDPFERKAGADTPKSRGWNDEDFEVGSPESVRPDHVSAAMKPRLTQTHRRYTAHDVIAFLDAEFPGIHGSKEAGAQYSVHTHMAVINILGRGSRGCPPGLAWERCLKSMQYVSPRANKSIDVVIWQLSQAGLWEQATKTFASLMRARRAALAQGRGDMTGSVSMPKYLWPQCSYMILASIIARQATAQHITELRRSLAAPTRLATVATSSPSAIPIEMLLRLAEMGVSRTDDWNVIHVICCILCTAPSSSYLDSYVVPELRARRVLAGIANTPQQFHRLGAFFFRQLHDCAKFHCEQEWAAPNGEDGTEYIHSLADIQLQPMRLLRRPATEFIATAAPLLVTSPPPLAGSSPTTPLASPSPGLDDPMSAIPLWHRLDGPSLTIRCRRNALLEDRWVQALTILAMMSEMPDPGRHSGGGGAHPKQYYDTLSLLPSCAAAGLPTSAFF